MALVDFLLSLVNSFFLFRIIQCWIECDMPIAFLRNLLIQFAIFETMTIFYYQFIAILIILKDLSMTGGKKKIDKKLLRSFHYKPFP